MSYDDDYEEEDEAVVTEPPKIEPRPTDIQVAFTVSADSVEKAILSWVPSLVQKHYTKSVEDTVTSAVHDLVAEIARDEIAAAVKSVLAEGWKRTNEYGEARGVASLKDRISELLNGRDRYGDSAKWVEKVVKEETQAALKGELAKEIEAARVKLRAEVDQVTRAKLNEALRSALGVS